MEHLMFGFHRNALTIAAGAATLGVIFATLATNVAMTQEGSLQDIAKALPSLPQIVIY
jgi:hypothetical protein